MRTRLPNPNSNPALLALIHSYSFSVTLIHSTYYISSSAYYYHWSAKARSYPCSFVTLQIQSYELETRSIGNQDCETRKVRDYENKEVCYQVYVGGIWVISGTSYMGLKQTRLKWWCRTVYDWKWWCRMLVHDWFWLEMMMSGVMMLTDRQMDAIFLLWGAIYLYWESRWCKTTSVKW